MRCILILLLGLSQVSRAGFEQTEAGSRARALGGAYTAVSGEIWTLAFNVGGLSRLQSNEVSFFYSPSPFGISALSIKAASAAFPTKIGVVAFAVRRYGFALYREFSGTFSYAHSISKVGFGFSLNRHSVFIERYGSASTLGLDAGAIVEVSSRLGCGLCIKNLNAPTIGASRETLPQIYAIGIVYSPAGNVVLALDYRKETGHEASARSGIEYGIIDALALRVGLSDAAGYTGGFGLRLASLRLDYAFEAYPELGWTHAVTLSICWGGSRD